MFCCTSVPFKLHVEALYKLLRWCFIHDHYKYAHWITMHLLRPLYHWNKIFRCSQLSFKRKLFIRKSHREFSRTSLDHIYDEFRTSLERVWITSMRRVISLSTGVEVHVVYLRKSIIQPLFTGKPVVPKLPVYCNTWVHRLFKPKWDSCRVDYQAPWR